MKKWKGRRKKTQEEFRITNNKEWRGSKNEYEENKEEDKRERIRRGRKKGRWRKRKKKDEVKKKMRGKK